MSTNQFTVFTKPWPEKTLAELAEFVKKLGFDGVELPVRPGYQVVPEKVGAGLPEAARIFEDHGVKIGSVAGPADEPTIAACAEAGVPIIRIMAGIDMKIGYMASEANMRKQYDALVPLLDQHGVTLGVQNHCSFMVGSAIGLMHLIEGYDPKHIGAVLDPAHCGLDGEPDAMAIDIAWSHLVLVNLKSAYWKKAGTAEDGATQWSTFWCTGKEGITNWRIVAEELKKRGYRGDLCLTAEYSNPEAKGDLKGDAVDPLITKDIQYARPLFA
jgi:sugar phosphate isomerase/epimerase